MKSLINFISCIFHLGPKLGYKYWKISEAARKRPEITLEIAEGLEREAENCQGLAKESVLDFAQKCRESYANYTK